MARYLKLEQNHNGTRTFSISPSIFITFRLFLSRQVFSFDFAKWFHSIQFYISPSFSISPKSAISPSFQFRQVYEGKSLLAKCRKLAKWRNWRNLHNWRNRVLPIKLCVQSSQTFFNIINIIIQMIQAKFKCLPIFDAIIVGQRAIKLFRQYIDELINWHIIATGNLGKRNARTLAVTTFGDLNKLI